MLSPEAVSPDAALRAQAAPRHTFSFRGEGTSLFVLMLKNMVLTLVTLGIYMPWAKTERRKFLWQNIEFGGHRLRYHGTGKELFKGYLLVVLGYLVVVGLPLLVTKLVSPTAGSVLQVLLFLALIPLVPFAIWGSRRYLLSRTSWRGVHFRLEGPAGPYVKAFFLGYLFTLLSLGFYAPIWLNRLHRMVTNQSALGTQHFEYRGDDKQAFRIGIKGLLLSIVTFGFYSFWYQAELGRFQMQNTWFGGAQGEFDITGGDLFKLTLLQVLALTFTLGLAFPWVVAYSLSFVLERMRFVGPIDFARIYPQAGSGSAAADGLADGLDVGLAV